MGGFRPGSPKTSSPNVGNAGVGIPAKACILEVLNRELNPHQWRITRKGWPPTRVWGIFSSWGNAKAPFKSEKCRIDGFVQFRASVAIFGSGDREWRNILHENTRGMGKAMSTAISTKRCIYSYVGALCFS